jgi:hypothetical protein
MSLPNRMPSVEDFLAAPLACAFFVLAERLGVTPAEAARPATALELAARALYLLDPWSGHQDALAQVIKQQAQLARHFAATVTTDSEAAWWYSGLDRRSQVWLGSSAHKIRDVRAPSWPASEREMFEQQPEHWFATFTGYGGVTLTEAMLAHQAGDWDPELPLPRALVTVAPEARVAEILEPEDWRALSTQYGVPHAVDYPPGDLGRWVPEWARVAEDFDGVHLTFSGLLTGYCVPSEGASGRAMLRWESERTLWLRPAFLGWTEEAPLTERPPRRLLCR